jgi:formylglycine-generating enzyme required for sulfatase activity
MSWDDAAEFCDKLTSQEQMAGRLPSGLAYRLPTHAEWEYACRAGTRTRYSFGNDASKLGDYAWFYKNTEKIGEPYAHEVRLKKANPWGLHDMHGNVFEWCRDWHDDSVRGGIDPVGPATGEGRFITGGSWWGGTQECRSATCGPAEPSVRDFTIGFRVALIRTEIK